MLSLDCHGKKAAGVSYRPAVQGHLFFVEQSCVDEHVAGAKTHKLIEKVCPFIQLLLYIHVYMYEIYMHAYLTFVELQ